MRRSSRRNTIHDPLKTPARHLFVAIPAGLDAFWHDGTLDDATYRKLPLEYGFEWLE